MQIYREHELAPALSDELQQSSDCSLFAIIDGTGAPDALYHFFRYAPEANYHPLFLGTDLEHCLPHSPYLAHISLSQVEYMELASQTRQGVLWFTSPLTLHQQIDFWKCRLYVHTDNVDTRLFRYWSGPITHHYLAALKPEQQQQFLSPVASIATPDADSRQWTLRTIQPSNKIHLPLPLDTWTIPEHHLDIFNDRFEHIQISEIEAALWSRIPETLDQTYPAFIPQRIAAGINQARQLELHSDYALEKFIECQFRWGNDFWRHPDFAELWEASNTEQGFLSRIENAIY
ncbi:MAG: DUF4123 domain-containing protein [Ketobacter sp.]|nr:DUF4123 domain-containing protein [Ketobacter sp.]